TDQENEARLSFRHTVFLSGAGWRGAHVNDRLGIRIDTAPAGKRIEAADGTLLRLQKCPSDRVPVEQRADGGFVASLGPKVAVKKRIPIELGAAVDKGRDTAED